MLEKKWDRFIKDKGGSVHDGDFTGTIISKAILLKSDVVKDRWSHT